MLAEQPDWRTEGCGAGCYARSLLVPGRLIRELVILHDPSGHERYGRLLAGDILAAPLIQTGPLAISRIEYRVWVDDAEVFPTPREWQLLLALLDGAGQVVPAQTLVSRIWGDTGHDERRVVRTTLNRLRGRLGAAGGLIETMEGIGYRLRLDGVEAMGLPVPVRRPGLDGRWSRAHDRCRRCTRSTRAHVGHGLCGSCYRHLERHDALGPYRQEGQPCD